MTIGYTYGQIQQDKCRLLLKADIKSVLLQPKSSLELFFLKKISIEAGACKFWTGQQIYSEISGPGYFLLLEGHSKGNDIYSELKHYWSNGLFIGAGYLHRYSHFKNVHNSYEVKDGENQYYTQSEKAYSNFFRTSIGMNIKIENKNLYINPYGALMFGRSSVQVDIDTTGSSNLHSMPKIFPRHDHYHITKVLLQMGCNIGFGVLSVNRKRVKTKE